MTFLEQSVKLAARQYIFSPNTSDTWLAVKSMITSFLMGVWRSGGLQGSSPADAFQVNVGLGSTMTADDVLNGYLRVSVLVATVRPAEFLVIMFQQEQAKSA
ncbi:Phage tail sheath protein FI [Pseudomonas amygdali pv. morsprunorum]|nr:Phage tail sheath protein FI [Pseudomonas amygdali pv. morsprunorum]